MTVLRFIVDCILLTLIYYISNIITIAAHDELVIISLSILKFYILNKRCGENGLEKPLVIII